MNGTTSRLVALGLAFIMALGALVFIPDSAEAASTPAWAEKTPLSGNFSEAAYCQIGDVVYIFGGCVSNGYSATVNTSISYNLSTGDSQTLAPMPLGMRGAAVAAFQDMIYVFGGYNSTIGHSVDNLQIYDTSTDAWSYGPNMPVGAWQAKAVLYETEQNIYVIGGENASDLVQIYNPRANVWTSGAPYPTSITNGAAVSDNGNIYYFGGINWTGEATNESYCYNGYSWYRLPNMPLATTYPSVVSGPDGFIYVLGGGQWYPIQSQPVLKSVQMYDLSANSWMMGPDLPRSLGLSAAAMAGDSVYILGGMNSSYVPMSNVFSLKVMNSSLTVLTPDVLSGQEMNGKMTISYAFRPSVQIYGVASLTYNGVTYGSMDFGSVPGEAYLTLAVSGTAPSGTYQLKVTNVDVSVPGGNWFSGPDMNVPVAVTLTPSLDQQIADLNSDILSLSAEMNSAQTQLDDLSANISTDRATLTALQTKLADLENQLNQADILLASMGSSFEARADEISGNHNLTNAQVALLRAQVEALNAQLNESKQQLGTLQSGQDKLMTSVDGRADGTMAMITLIMVVIGIALMAVVLVLVIRKK